MLLITAIAGCLPAAQASTEAYDQMVASGSTQEGIFPRIVIRDDVGLAASAAFAADPAFNGVAAIGGCTAVLIAPTTVLSTRPCGPSAGGRVRFGTNRNAPSFTSSIQAVSFPGAARRVPRCSMAATWPCSPSQAPCRPASPRPLH